MGSPVSFIPFQDMPGTGGAWLGVPNFLDVASNVFFVEGLRTVVASLGTGSARAEAP